MSSRKKSDDAEVIRKKTNTTDRGLSSLRGKSVFAPGAALPQRAMASPA
jgi:hypothetical protein